MAHQLSSIPTGSQQLHVASLAYTQKIKMLSLITLYLKIGGWVDECPQVTPICNPRCAKSAAQALKRSCRRKKHPQWTLRLVGWLVPFPQPKSTGSGGKITHRAPRQDTYRAPPTACQGYKRAPHHQMPCLPSLQLRPWW